jgi:transcriptional regulator with GAF, ATPase, and Fis domain
MLEIPSRDSLNALLAGARLIGSATAVGVARPLEHDRVSVLYAFAHGVGEFMLPSDGLPDVLVPTGDEARDADGTTIRECPARAAEAFLIENATERVVSVPLPGGDTPARFWVAFGDGDPLSPERSAQLMALAGGAAHELTRRRSPEERLRTLERLEQAAGLMPALLHVLDVRDVIDRLSVAANRALAHDVLLLILFSEDLSTFTVYARSNQGAGLPSVMPNPYPASVIQAWTFTIVDDHTRDPLQRDSPATRMGARSSLRFPVRFDDAVIGGIGFVSFTPYAYSDADVPVGKRLADHVASAISHFNLAQRLAAQAKQTEELRAQTTNLELLDELLAALTDAGDLRDVFDRVSAITAKVLPHDAAALLVRLPDGRHARLYASSGFPPGLLPETVEIQPELLDPNWEHDIVDDLSAAGPRFARAVTLGFRSHLRVPIRFEGEFAGGLIVVSRSVASFKHSDILVARRIADRLAVTLAREREIQASKRADEAAARAAKLERLNELLLALGDDGELGDIIDRISAIARKVMPHDAMLLAVYLPDGRHVRRYVSSGFDPLRAPDVVELPVEMRGAHWDHHIVDDLASDATDGMVAGVALGCRSALRIAVHLDKRIVSALVFLKRESGGFRHEDVAMGRRVADRIALRLSHERGFEATRRADEATERAARLEARVRALTDELDARTGYRRVIGDSASWRQVLTEATQVAATETTALLLGESGTGKEVIARFLHRASPRSAGPFVALNCAALPEHLLEAELFGYERGAFTGATQTKPGQLEQAAGGTLFLDEVGEMSLPAQAKFLRVLQEREFQRLGGTRVLRADARIVAATNRDLVKAIANGQFREDLFYRLNVFAIRLPPLRERKEDILPLTQAFLNEFARTFASAPAGISREAKQMLLAYAWPGNIRELRNVLERAAILCDGGLITDTHLALPSLEAAASVRLPSALVPATAAPPAERGALNRGDAAQRDLQTMERAAIEQALKDARFNKSKAAKELGLTRHQLYIRMRRHGLTA